MEGQATVEIRRSLREQRMARTRRGRQIKAVLLQSADSRRRSALSLLQEIGCLLQSPEANQYRQFFVPVDYD